jgi:hypothetical protein
MFRRSVGAGTGSQHCSRCDKRVAAAELVCTAQRSVEFIAIQQQHKKTTAAEHYISAHTVVNFHLTDVCTVHSCVNAG